MATGHAEPGSRQARNAEARNAQQRAEQAVLGLVRDSGGVLITRTPASGRPESLRERDADPLAGVHAARAIELAARAWACRYIRAAREDGHTWHEIGAALGVTADEEGAGGETIAEAAFRYATGPADSHWDRTYGPSVTWRCPACAGLISDHGPWAGSPRDAERGHADGCGRLAAVIAAVEAGGPPTTEPFWALAGRAPPELPPRTVRMCGVARICHGTRHETQDGITVEFAKELRAQAARVPADGPPPVTLARQRAADAVEAAAAALSADPTLAERQQRNLDLLIELLRRLTPLARQTAVELERQRLAMARASTAHLGRTNPLAFEELDAVSGRCPVIAARITAAVQPDWDSPRRVRELSASRLPGAHELAEIADRLRHAVAPALDLPYPDPEAVRLAALAGHIDLREAGKRRCAGPGCHQELAAARTGRRRVYCGPACRQRARRIRSRSLTEDALDDSGVLG